MPYVANALSMASSKPAYSAARTRGCGTCGWMYSGARSDAAASKIGQLSGWSRLRSPVRPNSRAPLRPSVVTARSSSCAAAAGEAGRGEQDPLDVDPRLVHRRDPALSDLAQPLPQLPRRGAGPRVIARGEVKPAPCRDDLVGDEMLFGANRLHLVPAFCRCHRPA